MPLSKHPYFVYSEWFVRNIQVSFLGWYGNKLRDLNPTLVPRPV